MISKTKLSVTILLAASLVSFPTYVRSQQPVELLLGTPTNSVAWFPLYVAIKKGFFHEQGLAIKPVIMPNQASVPALVQKEIPYITNLGRVLSGAGRGLPIKQIIVLAAKTHHLLVTAPDIASPGDLRGRTVAVSQPGATPHRELLAILKKYNVDSKEVPVIGLGSDMNRVIALKQKRVDAIMTAVPYDFLLEKDGFRRLLYVKEVVELPLSGLVTYNDRLRERPDEVRKVLAGVLRGIAVSRARRDEVIPLLREFIGLESLEMTQRAYEAVKDIWPADGMPTEEGLKNAIAIEDVPANVPVTNMVNGTPLKQAIESLQTR